MKKFLVVLGVIGLLGACDDRMAVKPQFPLGSMVKTKIDGRKGQIIYLWNVNKYSVRFCSDNKNCETVMNGFELEPADAP